MKSVPDLFPKCICKQAKQEFSTKKKTRIKEKEGKTKGTKSTFIP